MNITNPHTLQTSGRRSRMFKTNLETNTHRSYRHEAKVEEYLQCCVSVTAVGEH